MSTEASTRLKLAAASERKSEQTLQGACGLQLADVLDSAGRHSATPDEKPGLHVLSSSGGSEIGACHQQDRTVGSGKLRVLLGALFGALGGWPVPQLDAVEAA